MRGRGRTAGWWTTRRLRAGVGRAVRPVRDVVVRARRQVRADLRADPYLGYVLVLAFVLAGFWFWHRVPNFATRDERWRIVDPFETVGFVARDPGVDSLGDGLRYWRTYGATLHLFGLTALPVFVVLFVTGQGDVFAATTTAWSDGLWTHWLGIPRWVWTTTLLAGRLANVAFAVGCVYVVYRIGTAMGGRPTGRLAALLLTLTWAFLVLAHEVGEDVPALFFLLLALYGALRYAETGASEWFYGGCLAGGVAISFKLTAGVAVPMLGVAYLLRARRSGVEPRDALVRPRLLGVGAACGLVVVALGYPGVLVVGPEVLFDRLARGAQSKTSLHGYRSAPNWWWLARGTLHGLGLPLALAVLVSVPVALFRIRERSVAADGIVLALVGVATYRFVYAGWTYVRTHHLLPAFALLVVVLATVATEGIDRRPSVARPVVAALVVTTAAYAGVGVAGYATQPRDAATDWLAANAGENATVETYVSDPQEAPIPHGTDVFRPTQRAMVVDGERVRPPETRWILAMPRRCPAFIVLTAHESLQYLAPDDYSRRADLLANPTRERYVRDLLAEDTYPYEVAARFGPRPRYLDADRPRPTWRGLLRAGLVPRSVQYGDGQDMGSDQYTVVLERTGQCDSDETSPL